MLETNILELDIGDIIKTKKYDRTLLIVDKEEKTYKKIGDICKYIYTCLDLLNGEYYGIYGNCTSEDYERVG